jgi:hypothetical protein
VVRSVRNRARENAGSGKIIQAVEADRMSSDDNMAAFDF